MFFDEDIALIILLEADILFVSNMLNKKDNLQITLYINCNDLFAWGCADAEEFSFDDVETLYYAWEKEGALGISKWVCHKRNEKPQKPMIKIMKEKRGLER